MILLVFWLIAYACSILLLIFGVQRLRAGSDSKKSLSIDEVTIVIPFRNEAKNLQLLIDCIRRQSYQPNQWIFVNDHSEDDFRSAFDEVKNFPIRVLNLPDEQDGKKAALRFGMDHSTSNYTLTMDADVQFGKDFIKSLLVMPEMDMLILPVEMVGKKWWQEFFNLEYRLTHILNKGVSGWFRPINASGANLLMNQSVFDEVNDLTEHEHIASGDDIFALKAFRENGKSIGIIEMDEIAVQTNCLESFSQVIHQRQRWLGKSGKVNDSLATGVGVWMVFIHITYFFLITTALLNSDWWMFLVYILYKGFFDFALINLDIKSTNKKFFVGLILFELLYPLYVLYLLFSMIYNDPEWKGREV